MVLFGTGRYLRLARQGVVATERRFVFVRSDGVCGNVTLMPMVHLAAGHFFASTLRSPHFSRFDLAFTEGPFGCTTEQSWPRWRFIASPFSASPLALSLEACWLIFFRTPLAISNALGRLASWEPLRLQPQPLCGESGQVKFVVTDDAELGATVLTMVSFGSSDQRADRLVDSLLRHVQQADGTLEVVVPWGSAHMSYIERRLLCEKFAENNSAFQERVVCAWGPLICANLCIWAWWWALHNALDTLFLWRSHRVLVVRLPFFCIFGASLRFDGSAST